QQCAIDLQLGDSPGMRPKPRRSSADQSLDVTVELLKMLGPKEHPLGPYDFVIPGHRTGRNGWRQRNGAPGRLRGKRSRFTLVRHQRYGERPDQRIQLRRLVRRDGCDRVPLRAVELPVED